MYLQSWEKRYSGITYGGDSVFDPAVQLSGILGCPCCKNNQPVEGPGHRIGQRGLDTSSPADRLARCIEWEMQQLVQQRACETCGVISVMPPADVARLKQQVEEQVTLTWVEAQERRVIDEQEKTA